MGDAGHRCPRTKTALAALLVMALATACGPTGALTRAPSDTPPAPAPTATPGGAAAPAPGVGAFALVVTPASGARNLPVSTEIGLHVTGGRTATVVLTRAGGGARVKGALREDGTSWVPGLPLAFASTYTATVTGRSEDGVHTLTATTTFTTMGHPWRQTGTGLYLFSGQTYGVAMPVVVEFHPAVSASVRAGVQRRLFVTANPPQPGVWHWPSGSQAFSCAQSR